MKDKILEVDLYKPVYDFLVEKGYEVRSEVNFCDVTAVKGEELIVIELKKSLNVDLLVQAVNRQKFADLVYIAVPKPKKMIFSAKWKDICHLIRRLELGLILVSFKKEHDFVEVVIEPQAFDRQKSINMNKKKREAVLKEFRGRNYDLNTGGSRGKKLITAYRENAIYIACCLEKFGPLSPKKLRELGTDSKKTLSILSQNHYNWFEKVDRGIYQINQHGRDDLQVYEKLSNYYFEEIEKQTKTNEDKGRDTNEK